MGKESSRMSSSRRPWYPWYPKDFIVDEKVQALSPIAELVYRRALDVMWQANDCQLLNQVLKLWHQFGKGLAQQEFENAWSEIQHPGFELFKITQDGNWIYSKRLKIEAEKIEKLCNIRRKAASKGGIAKAKADAIAKGTAKAQQRHAHTDPDPDPDNKEKTRTKKKSQSNGKSQIPADFKVTPEMKSWFDSQNFQRIEIESATEQFIDYWKSQGKMMKDWIATWRNGMRNADKWAKDKPVTSKCGY